MPLHRGFNSEGLEANLSQTAKKHFQKMLRVIN